MKFEEERQKELEQRERILREKEVELRLREMEQQISPQDVAFHKTVKHQPEQKPWMKKVILGAKLFGLGVAALVAVRIASVLAGLIIIATLGWVTYQLFFAARKNNLNQGVNIVVNQVATDKFIQDLERVSQVRSKISVCLNQLFETINQAELAGDTSSGKLSLERDLEDISIASKNLQKGVFRLLVLGDMKRGKSTFLNALIGENLLPSDVNPCTAVLTVLRYGAEKKVTIHFNDGKSPQILDFQSFKYKYTIDPAEAKKLEQEKKQAFPDVDYAVVEYPLTLLEKGIEIVDSPGLNDTEARNELSLGYVNNCHAILFVMRASQPCTLGERRYLENYIKGRGLSVFFLINAWDQVKESLIDPDDVEELKASEDRLRQVFKANLSEYCYVDGQDIYDERVFELSSIQALRRRLKNPQADLTGTGFSEFMGSLNIFLTRERAIAELRQARTLARQAVNHTREAIDRRLPLLDQDVDELKNGLILSNQSLRN